MATCGSRRVITPEQIKKLFEIAKPDRFEYVEATGKVPKCLKDPENRYILIDLELNKSMSYRLFLQGCIEGINRNYRDNIQDRFFINTDPESMDIWDNDDRKIAFYVNFEEYQTIDQAKEQALIYILDNIQKQD